MFNLFKKQEQGQVKLGTRVIRGPDWIHKCEDNGEGFLGTIVAFSRSERWVEVIWDTGRSGQYRANPGEYDLRIFDNAPTGEFHPGTACIFCSTTPINGMKWTCIKCNVDLCTQCYMKGSHEDTHSFERSDTSEARRCKVGPRQSCTKELFAKGIFEGAEVVPGPSWMYGCTTNGNDVGYIVHITHWRNKYHRGIVSVFWKASNKVQLYRLGAEGCVDIVCSRLTENATGGRFYPHHLPVVDLNRISDETPDLMFYNSDVLDSIKRIPSAKLNIIGKRQEEEHFEIWKGMLNEQYRKDVDIKMFLRDSYADVLKEVSLIHSCNHQNVIKLYGITSISNCIVLEWWSDNTLLQFLRSEKGQMTTLEQIFYIAAQIAAGMNHLQDKRILHRDLKANNVMIDNRYKAKITGFHAAVKRSSSEKGVLVPTTSKFSTRWAAPEVLDGISNTVSDVWSFGVLLYELITLGGEPYPGTSDDLIYTVLTSQGIPKPVTGVPCPTYYYKVLMQCCSILPLSRPTFPLLVEYFVGFLKWRGMNKYLRRIPLSDLCRNITIRKSTLYTTWKGTWLSSMQVSMDVFTIDCYKEVMEQAVIMRLCEHTHIVELLGITPDLDWIVTKWFSETNLSEMMSLDEYKTFNLTKIADVAAQIANGMNYLSTNRIIHRDLRASNVLISYNFKIKISGFYIAVVQPGNKDENTIIATSKRGLPMRWSAIEIFFTNTVTVKMDVWSYGILLTELLSHGLLPYKEMKHGEIKEHLMRGFRHPQPENCPDVLYEIMLKCWSLKPENRPTFDYLFDFFDGYIVSAEPVWAVFPPSKAISFENNKQINQRQGPAFSQKTVYEKPMVQSRPDINTRRYLVEEDLQQSKEDEMYSDESIYNDDVEVGGSSASEGSENLCDSERLYWDQGADGYLDMPKEEELSMEESNINDVMELKSSVLENGTCVLEIHVTIHFPQKDIPQKHSLDNKIHINEHDSLYEQ